MIVRQQIENRNDTQPQCSLQVQIEWSFTYTPPMHLHDRYFGFNLSYFLDYCVFYGET